ncbi:MAG: hypothetical protein CM1200mP10_12890 [Candidatus Neomarinimicrobiota bacterium]|nr:MAG: hypothetical protein CM1200mP10_12890 [Candidatus Neomarinimicrobiota bacterium]
MAGTNWIGFWTLIRREVGRFFSVYRQTVLPGLISSGPYILVFGFTLERRIEEIKRCPLYSFYFTGITYDEYLTNATANTSSSMLQMKLLQQLPDILTAPLSAMEISLAYIIGGTVRGTVNGILVMLLGMILIDMPVPKTCGNNRFYCHGILVLRQYGVSPLGNYPILGINWL